MSFIQNLYTSRDNNANAATYVGQQDRIWWDPVTNTFYYSDGNTAGGIPIGISSGNGIPGGPANSIQYNAGGGFFGGSSSLTFNGSTLSVIGNVAASAFNSDIYQYANGVSIFTAPRLGNLYVIDQTVFGTNINGNIDLTPEGSGIVNIPALGISPIGTFLEPYVASGGENPGIQLKTISGYDITLSPGATANILTSGNVMPTGNNLAALGDPGHRYTGVWLGSGNINLIDQTLNQNQQIYANNGNLIFANANGIKFGDFEIFGNTISTINPAANILIGLLTSNAYVEINRPLTVNSTGGGGIAFQVERDGTTQINVPGGIAANTAGALNIVGSSDGAYQNVTNSGGMIHLTGPENSASRITVDAYGTQGGTGAPSALVLRAARGNAGTPTATQVNDTLGRVSALGWGTTFGPSTGGLSPTAIEFVALENYTNTAQGSKITFNTANIGSNSRSVSATVQANGVSFLNNTIANSGITFRDGTFQNTAYVSSNVVNSVTVNVGLSQNQTTGAITIDNTGVLQATGTPQQVRVNGSYTVPQTGNIVLGLPQDIATNSTVTFANVTVTGNLYVTGNTVSGNTFSIESKILYLANNSTSNNDINFGGIALGNVNASYSRTILYDLANDRWTTAGQANSSGIANFYSPTLFGANVVTDYLDVTYTGHFGTAYDGNDFASAEIQAYSDVNGFSQVVSWNKNSGSDASTDFVAVNDLGNTTNETNYIDLGINSSNYSNVDYIVSGPNDGYLYVNSGNLVIGTQTAGKVIKFHTGGTDNTNYVRATINDAGLSVVGNITAGNLITSTTTIDGGVTSIGNITGANLNTTGTVRTGTLTASATISATGNITGGALNSTGIISAVGNIVTTANVIAGYVVTTSTTINGSGVTSSGNITGANLVSNGNIVATGNINSPNVNTSIATVSALLSVSGNITGGNLITGGLLSTTGNVSAGNVNTAGRVVVTGNVDAGNLRTSGTVAATTVSATGNITTGGFFIGNGSQLTGLNAFQTVAANGTNLIADSTSGILTLTPGNNIVITGNASTDTARIAVNDNPTFATLNVIGNITVTGNVIAGNTSYTNVANIVMSNTSPLGTAIPGMMEYDGRVLYFTGQDQERGIVPSQQWYVLNADRGLTYASTTAQSLFGVGVHVSNSTRYWFRIKTTVSRSSGTNNTAFTLGWRGTATPTTITYLVNSSIGTVSTPKVSYQYETELISNFTNQVTVTTTSNPPDSVTVEITGIIDVGAAGVGYLEPFISWTGAAAPGSVTVESLSSFQIYPLGVTGANTSVGNWA
jgi:hypothetical protein